MHTSVTAGTDLGIAADPVSRISISGFHGAEEVRQHVAHAATQDELNGRRSSLRTLLLGVAIGAGLMYLLRPRAGAVGGPAAGNTRAAEAKPPLLADDAHPPLREL